MVTPAARLLLLGSPAVVHAGTTHALPFERRSQVAVLLALRQGWVPRAELAALLWPEQPARWPSPTCARRCTGCRRSPGRRRPSGRRALRCIGRPTPMWPRSRRPCASSGWRTR